MTVLHAINATLAFAIEMWMLWAFADWGWHTSATEWLRWTLAIGAPGLAIALWARWCAPKSTTRLSAPSLYIVEWSMFACAAAALYAVGRTQLAPSYLAVASINLAVTAALART